MKLLISYFICAFIGLCCMSAEDVGADSYTRNDVPWLASIRLLDKDHYCNGALINSEWVLTTASCLKYIKSEDMQVIVGSYLNFTIDSDSAVINITDKCLHEDYDEENNINDIALLKLENTAIEDTTNKDLVNTISLSSSIIKVDSSWTLFGWKNQTDEFGAFGVKVVPEDSCDLEKEEACVKSSINLKDTINSYIMQCESSSHVNEVCGLVVWANETTAALTEVYYYNEWITQTMEDGCSRSAGLFQSIIVLAMCVLVSFIKVL